MPESKAGRNKKYYLLGAIIVFSFIFNFGCQRPEHFLQDPGYRHQVHRQYRERLHLAQGRSQELFSVMKQRLTLEEREALEFLYAFMPLSDLANLDGEYFLEEVRTALKARNFFRWGKKIPEEIFRHFVLPYRVNNENPDPARQVFFNELKERIKGLDMYQAALEVNHWCHEKVTYRPTDERTSSPLFTVKTAFGRCGEESTFTVAALRAVSLPARQVYTPRWAHTDDNHAWVEVWVDGKWYYLGACEPEPELDRGWFSAPATRAMMVHTTVFGKYDGPEEALVKTDLFTKINLLPSYAPTSALTVEIRDPQGNPVAGASVDFCVYNYAEFYPIASKATDEQGRATLSTGLGDLTVQVYKDGLWTWSKVTVGKTETVSLTLTEPAFSQQEFDLDLIPPLGRAIKPLNPEKAEENASRLKHEDGLRQSYEATFINQDIARIFAREKGLPEEEVWKFLETSCGNWMEIMDYLSSLRPEEYRKGLSLLTVVTEKDLRDTPAQILLHHLRETPDRVQEINEELYLNYVLSPRIGRELLSPWRSFIKNRFNEAEKNQFLDHPEKIAAWIKTNIILDDSNYYKVPLWPHRAIQLGRADLYSLKVLFVAIARTLGIPARIDQVTGRVTYFKDGEWHSVFLETDSTLTPAPKKSTLKISYQPSTSLPKPSYYHHFTLARFNGNHYQTLDYENEPALKSFPAEITIDPGHYLLISGNRQPDGSVLCRLKFFEVPVSSSKEIELTFRPRLIEPEPLVQFLTSGTVYDLKRNASVDLSTIIKNQNFILLLIEPDKEPSKHLMDEIQGLREQFSDWRGLLVVAIARDKITADLKPNTYNMLPLSSKLLYDAEGHLLRSLTKAIKKEVVDLPVAIACRAGGRVIFYSEGYRIGTGDLLAKNLLWLK